MLLAQQPAILVLNRLLMRDLEWVFLISWRQNVDSKLMRLSDDSIFNFRKLNDSISKLKDTKHTRLKLRLPLKINFSKKKCFLIFFENHTPPTR